MIVDLSAVAHLDFSGCEILSEVQKELTILGAIFYLACPGDGVFDMLQRSQLLGEGPFHIFPTIHDAVLYHNVLADVITE